MGGGLDPIINTEGVKAQTTTVLVRLCTTQNTIFKKETTILLAKAEANTGRRLVCCIVGCVFSSVKRERLTFRLRKRTRTIELFAFILNAGMVVEGQPSGPARSSLIIGDR